MPILQILSITNLQFDLDLKQLVSCCAMSVCVICVFNAFFARMF